ncbi:hypothetical protein AB0J47_16175 [Nocardia sp. NPDC049737]|uniref:hypothetical protein n=1 Tax=Nocardia sp. NPDC049737 TaxID=3154358 RepID=UPI00343C3EDA
MAVENRVEFAGEGLGIGVVEGVLGSEVPAERGVRGAGHRRHMCARRDTQLYCGTANSAAGAHDEEVVSGRDDEDFAQRGAAVLGSAAAVTISTVVGAAPICLAPPRMSVSAGVPDW